MRARIMKMAALTALLALAAAACGGDDEAEDAAPREAEANQAGEEESEPERSVEVPTVEVADGEEAVIVPGQVEGIPTKSGFGVAGEDFMTPGATIRMRKGDTITLTLQNDHYCTAERPCLSIDDGRPFWEPHNLTIVEDKDVPTFDMEPLWGGHVGGFGDPNLEVGERGSVTVTAETAGEFFYVCAVSDHVARGMWGRFIVE